MVCPQFRSFVIDGFKLELPGIEWGGYEEFGGVFNIDYDSADNKIACINQTLLHCLILLPIKKITITFVDLKCSYEYELLLRNLPSILYNEKPVTSDEQMDRLLIRLEKRREDVIKKYGNYGEYCKKSHSTPLPYEAIVLYDEYYDKKYHDRLNSLIEWCKRIGVLIIIPRKKSKVFNLYEPYIVNPNGKELYIAKDIKENKWWEGFDNYLCNNNYTGLFINSDVISLYNPMPDFPGYNKPKDLIEEIQSVADDSNVIIGSGEYEVWIEKSKHINDFDFDRIVSQKIKNMIIDTPAQELIGCFQTEKEAEAFVDNFCLENSLPSFVGYAPVISLDTFLSGFWATKASLELYIDKERCSGLFEDLKFYFHQFGFTNEMANRIFGLLSGSISANNSNETEDDLGILCLRYWKVFPSKEDAEAFKKQGNDIPVDSNSSL